MFAKTVMQPLFPSILWIHDVEPAIAGPLNKRLIEILERLAPPGPAHSPGKGWQTDQILHERPEFQDVVNIFRTATRSVLDQYEVDYGEFEITGCWANMGPKGEVHPSHNHPNNFLSGVYYVQVAPGADSITFHEPRSQVSVIRPKVKRFNMVNSIVSNVTVQAGQLIIFPAWLAHSVQANQSDVLRISISFNVMFTKYLERVSKPKWDGLPLPDGADAQGD